MVLIFQIILLQFFRLEQFKVQVSKIWRAEALLLWLIHLFIDYSRLNGHGLITILNWSLDSLILIILYYYGFFLITILHLLLGIITVILSHYIAHKVLIILILLRWSAYRLQSLIVWVQELIWLLWEVLADRGFFGLYGLIDKAHLLNGWHCERLEEMMATLALWSLWDINVDEFLIIQVVLQAGLIIVVVIVIPRISRCQRQQRFVLLVLLGHQALHLGHLVGWLVFEQLAVWVILLKFQSIQTNVGLVPAMETARTYYGSLFLDIGIGRLSLLY